MRQGILGQMQSQLNLFLGRQQFHLFIDIQKQRIQVHVLFSGQQIPLALGRLQPAESQQILNQPAHVGTFLVYGLLVGRGSGVHTGPNHGKGCAQFMGGVRNEAGLSAVTFQQGTQHPPREKVGKQGQKQDAGQVNQKKAQSLSPELSTEVLPGGGHQHGDARSTGGCQQLVGGGLADGETGQVYLILPALSGLQMQYYPVFSRGQERACFSGRESPAFMAVGCFLTGKRVLPWQIGQQQFPGLQRQGMVGNFVETEGQVLVPQVDLISVVLFQAAEIDMGDHGLLLQAAGKIGHILTESVPLAVPQRLFRQ